MAVQGFALNALSQFLREYLDKTGLTIKAFAEKAGVHRNTVQNILTGNYTGYTEKTLRKIAKAAGKTLSVWFI